MSKPLHAGKAACNGLLAAHLAARGFTARDEMVDGVQGFAETHAPALHVERLEELGGRFLITETLFKYHAACYLTHSTIENLRALRAAGLHAEAVQQIEVRVHPAALKVCAIPEPRTGLEGKFSLRATAAMALLGDDTTDVAVFSDERMCDPALTALRDRVSVGPDDTLAEAEARLIAVTQEGRIERSHDAGLPNHDLADQWRRLEEKFRALATPVVGAERTRELAAAVRRLEALESVAELVRP